MNIKGYEVFLARPKIAYHHVEGYYGRLKRLANIMLVRPGEVIIRSIKVDSDQDGKTIVLYPHYSWDDGTVAYHKIAPSLLKKIVEYALGEVKKDALPDAYPDEWQGKSKNFWVEVRVNA